MQLKTKTNKLFSLEHTIAYDLFADKEYPWQALPEISGFILKLGENLPKDEYTLYGENIWVGKNVKIAQTASLQGPLIIDSGAEIRHCAYIRGSVIIGKNSVVGNSTELKNSVLFDGVQVPHYNYVGDSVLGYKSHMGAGAVTSNVKGDKTQIKVRYGGDSISTGLKKFGGILGDYCEVGCSAVLNPGTVLGKNCQIYPLSMVRGFVPENSIYKNKNEIVVKENKNN